MIQEPSLVKILIIPTNPLNNLNAFLYTDSKMNNLITYTEPTHDEKYLYTTLNAQAKAYKLKLVYDSIDEAD